MKGSSLLHQPKVKLSDHDFNESELIKKRFDFHLALLKNSVRYMQEVEGKNITEVTGNTMKLANGLVERFKFGSKFINELESYIKTRFQPVPASFKNSIVKDSGIEDPILFNHLLDDFKASADFENLSGRFKMIL